MTFHVLLNEAGGSVQSVEIEADSFLECEDKIRELYPTAVYWDVGLPD